MRMRLSRILALRMRPTLVLTAVLVASAAAFAAGTASLPTVRDDLSPSERARVAAVTAPATDFSKPEKFENMQGGATTSRKLVNQDAFSNFSANLSFAQEETFKLGNALFRKLWVSSPSSTQASDGLGPLFNARACQSCHLKDGRGHPPEGAADATSMFLRLSRAPRTPQEQDLLKSKAILNLPDPVYGGQLQDLAVPGMRAEGRMVVDYDDFTVALDDGTEIAMRRPTYSVADLAYGPMDVTTTLSPRVTPAMIGLGLVEQIHPADILALADPDDADGDGISGRANVVRDAATGEPVLGRFGWKAQNPTIRAQAAGAFSGDIGISSPDQSDPWGDCTEAQADCRAAPSGAQPRLGETEAPDPILDLVTFYSQHLAVPARRDVDAPEVLRGKEIFHALGCTGCHAPKFVTRKDAPDKTLAFQLIWPYSDFLLHDLGPAMADWQPVGDARGAEWRTQPLWGIGLTQTVSGHTFFLHDGRARNLTEAILWHGGEAEAATVGFKSLPKTDRDALIRFLESL
jgi:CxxC motif-containing protein (DUF1111 family)